MKRMNHNQQGSVTRMLDLEDYRSLVALDEPFLSAPPVTADEAAQLVEQLLAELLDSMKQAGFAPSRLSPTRLHPRDLLKALLTIRAPEPFLPSDFHTKLDRLFAYERRLRETTEAMAVPTVLSAYPSTTFASAATTALWQGDITLLRVDAIVNAANAALLGCFEPFHACIDNAIHTAAGPRLREDCHRIMRYQGAPEATGIAKITRGYHLPATFVLHTVGPIYRGHAPEPSAADKAALAASYRSCLDLAASVPSIRSLAFCCISTGVFGFPQEAAARVALQTVDQWLVEHPGTLDRVIFNVFRADDLAIYQSLLEE